MNDVNIRRVSIALDEKDQLINKTISHLVP